MIAMRRELRSTQSDSPPAHLLLRSDAIDLVRQKLSLLAEEIDQWEAITCTTDG